MSFQNPSVQDFKDYFFRDFPFQPDNVSPDIGQYVQDQDITKAFQMTNINFNPGFWQDQGSYNVGYFYLSAHYLVVNLRASSQGLNGQFSFLENSKSVGNVSQGFSIPQRVLDNPDWSVLMTTNYGAQYLQLVLPQLSGQVFNAYGRTLP